MKKPNRIEQMIRQAFEAKSLWPQPAPVVAKMRANLEKGVDDYLEKRLSAELVQLHAKAMKEVMSEPSPTPSPAKAPLAGQLPRAMARS